MILAIPFLRAYHGGRAVMIGASLDASICVPFPIMNDQEKIIGLSELLDEISRDLDELRKKHSSDYNVRNISMWWELERERVVARHGSGSTVMKLRKVQSMKRMMGAFLAGWILMIALQAALWVMFR